MDIGRNVAILLVVVSLQSCAGIEESRREDLSGVQKFRVKNYTVYIADYETVNLEWGKLKISSLPNRKLPVYGFTNFSDKEIWSIDSYTTLMHELKHMLEGDFHEPFKETEPSTLTKKENRLLSNIGGLFACINCHGKNGDSKGLYTQFLDNPPRDFTNKEIMKNVSDERMKGAIREGISGSGMPAYKDKLSDADIRIIIKFIRSLAGK